MRSLVLALAAAAALLVPSASHAQLSIGVRVGVSQPVGDLEELDLTSEQIREYRGTLTQPGKESPCRTRTAVACSGGQSLGDVLPMACHAA